MKLEWEPLEPSAHPRLDAGAFQIGGVLYCVAGYESQERVVNVISQYDLERNRWSDEIQLPPEIPRSHFALACEKNRFVYIAAGQIGPRCSPATPSVSVWDLQQNTWRTLPDLPEPRYSPTMQFIQGRLHIVGGSKPDRYTPVADHFSLGVSDGRAFDKTWRAETPIPRAGMHRGSAVIGGRLYVFGGQEGDFIPIPGDADFSCDGRTVEKIHGEVFEWSDEDQEWLRSPPMPVAASHIEFSTVTRDQFVIIAGGSSFKDPKTFSIQLTDAIQVFDTKTKLWTVAGQLPFRVKTCLVAVHKRWLYIATGQRDKAVNDPSPGKIENSVWRAQFFHDY